MKLAILHLDTREISDYGDVSLASKQAYAARWGFSLITVRGTLDPSRPPSWSKILLCKRMLDSFEWLWWLDADAGITNLDIDVRKHCEETTDLIATRDANGLNCGSFLLRNSDGARKLLDAAWRAMEFVNHPWWEQAAIQAILTHDDTISVRYIDQRAINSYPENWSEGDLVIHCPARPNRLAVLSGYLKASTSASQSISFPSPSDGVSIDQCHASLLYGAAVSRKPDRLLELGVGGGYATSALLAAIRFNGRGRLTCVDSLFDWHGKMPQHLASLHVSGVKLVVQDERSFLQSCANDSFDLIVSDADHVNAGSWVEEYLRVASDGAFLFFHDTANGQFPGQKRILHVVKTRSLAHYEFTESSRPGERCERGWLWVVNRKGESRL